MPTAVPPSGSSPDIGQDVASPLQAVPDRGGVPAELLAQHDRRRVHQVRPAALDYVGELGRLGVQCVGEVTERGSSECSISRTAARWIADGNTSLDDCEAFT